MEIDKIYEIRENILNYRYPIVKGVHDEKEYLDAIANEVKSGYADLELLIDEFHKFNACTMRNMKLINDSYIEQVNKAIKLEETAREIQGKVIDGGKLVSTIEGIHSKVSEEYKTWYGEVISELIIASRKFEKFMKEIYGQESFNMGELEKSWNKTDFRNARTAMSMLNKILEVYSMWNNEVATIMKNSEHYDGCKEEVVDQIKLIADRVYNAYTMFMEIPNPTEAIEREYKKLQEYLENKYK